MENLTVKTQEALQAAQTLAISLEHQALEPLHIFLGAWQTDAVLVEHLFKMASLQAKTLAQIAEAELGRIAKVEGGQAYMGRSAQEALQRALQAAKKDGDEFLTLEYVLLGLGTGKDSLAKAMKDQGFKEETFKQAIAELRNGRKARSEEHTSNSSHVRTSRMPSSA